MATTKRYIETVGRRKTSIARVRITPADKTSMVINEKPLVEYFDTQELTRIAESPLAIREGGESFTITVQVRGGGVHSQAEAVRHGIARALVAHNGELRSEQKAAGNLKRDPRMKERRKFGLKKARRAPQWSKR